MELREILGRGHSSSVTWPFLVELERGEAGAHVNIREIVRRPLIPLTRSDGVFGDVLVGRSAEAHVSLPAASVSQVHASFRPFPTGRWQLVDRESTNGTFVNGVRLEPNVPVMLSEGCIVRLGGKKYVFGGARLQALFSRLLAKKSA